MTHGEFKWFLYNRSENKRKEKWNIFYIMALKLHRSVSTNTIKKTSAFYSKQIDDMTQNK